jgi:hypothetical protein
MCRSHGCGKAEHLAGMKRRLQGRKENMAFQEGDDTKKEEVLKDYLI